MADVYLLRNKEGEWGTLGHIIAGEFQCYSLEPEAARRIPAKVYQVKRDLTGIHQWFKILDVPGRTDVEFHVGNILKDTKACILLGLECGERWYNTELGNQFGVWRSEVAMKRFAQHMNYDDFTLEIIDKT